MPPEESSPEISTRDLSALLGVTPQRISQYVAEGMPRLRRGWYDRALCLEWIDQFRNPGAGGRNSDAEESGELTTGITVADKRARLLDAQAGIAEEKLKHIRGLTVPREQVTRAVRAYNATIIRALEELIARAATAEQRAFRQEELDCARRAIADAVAGFDAAVSVFEPMAAPAISLRRRVG